MLFYVFFAIFDQWGGKCFNKVSNDTLDIKEEAAHLREKFNSTKLHDIYESLFAEVFPNLSVFVCKESLEQVKILNSLLNTMVYHLIVQSIQIVGFKINY